MGNGTEPGVRQVPATALRAAIVDGATVVTATRRLARTLAAEDAAARTQPAWATPDILPWGAWLERAYRDLRDHGRLAQPRPVPGETQSAALWESVLGDDARGRELTMLPGAAAECRAAWELAHEWELDRGDLLRGGEDSRRFAALADAYRAAVEAAGFVDPATLARIVAAHADGLPPARVLFHGFERPTPAQRRVMAALGDRAALVVPRVGGAPTAVALADPAAELAAAVAWARGHLLARPGARIGIVVPDLAAHAGRLEDLLDEALAPARLLPPALDAPRPWNLSLGRPLAESPVVAAALAALAAGAGEISSQDAGRLLRCPYLGEAGTEAPARAALDAWLRSNAGDRFPPARLAAWARRGSGRAACPAFAGRLSGLLEVLWAAPRRRPPSGWAEAFARALRAAGWPGEASPDSVEYQASVAWADLLDALAGLDAVTGPVGLAEALARLRRLAGERLFQPESGEAPVQVMGLYETAGLSFDALWVTGLHDGVMPAPLRPCPLLPAPVQRERRMPRACPEAELELARAWLARIGAAAAEVVISWPRRDGEEPLRPSPVLRGLAEGDAPSGPAPDAATAQFEARDTEAFPDVRGAPLAGEARGGTGLLKAQAACPFQAYAKYRLGCEPMDRPAPGVDPLTRGRLLHDALRRFWSQTGDQATLAGLEAGARHARVRAAVDAACAAVVESLAHPPPATLLDIEAGQAVRVVEALLEADLARTPFRVARAEEWLSLAAGGLVLRGCVDRVDEVAGGYAVIDYKTGDARRSDWTGERPREPQLPLYAVNLDGVAAVALGTLRPGSVGYQGFARDEAAMGRVGPARKGQGAQEWADLLEGWRGVLAGLAAGLAAGDARVDPRDGRRTCEYCGLQALCRRDELAARGAIPDD